MDGQPNGQNYMTLQLTLPALNRLLEVGGEDFIVKMTNATITEAVASRVKQLLGKALEGQVTEAVAGQVGTIDYLGSVKLKPEYKKAVAQEALNQTNKVREELTKLIEATIAEQMASLRLDVAKKLETLITAAVKTEVQSLVKAKIREIMMATE